MLLNRAAGYTSLTLWIALTAVSAFAEAKDIPQNGSAARFDDLGLFIFATEEEALAFVQLYDKQTH